MALPASITGPMMSTLGAVTTRLQPIVTEVLNAAAEDGIDVTRFGKGIWHLWGKDGNPDNTEHYSGNAIDFMIRDKYDGDYITDYLWANRSRFGLTHMIWRQRIKSTDPRYSPGQWVPMANRGSTTDNHMDHVHAWFDGDRGGAPGVVTKVPVTNKPEPKGDISMADAATIMARLDTLQAAVQTMANALAGKIDYANTKLNPDNKDGLQAAVQKMANALAATGDETLSILGTTAYEVRATDCRTRAIMYATCEPDKDGLWPCSWDHPDGPDDDDSGKATAA